MVFRLKAFGWHLLASSAVLATVLGLLYLGWYRWPAWYLVGALSVTAVMAGVDLVLGPLTTFVVASPAKPRRTLARDISVIVAVQLLALGYAAYTLWIGRPLYYTFSAERIELVCAFELSPAERALAARENPALAPHWWSRPRWVYAALPDDQEAAAAIVKSAVDGGTDIIDMPRFFKPWSAGLPQLQRQLRAVGEMTNLSAKQRERAAAAMRARGLPTDAPTALLMAGRDDPLVAVFDPASLEIRALVKTR